MARVAMMVTDDFEDVELTDPLRALRSAGHDVALVGPQGGQSVTGKRGEAEVELDRALADVSVDDFDALVLPGGYSPDKLRTDPDAVRIVREAFEHDRPVAAVCHAPSLLIEAGVVEGRTLTSWPSIKTDLTNAGAQWVDEEVVVDGELITSRQPDDLDAFAVRLIGRLKQVDVAAASTR